MSDVFDSLFRYVGTTTSWIYSVLHEYHEISAETGIWHMTCYTLNIVSHSNLLLNTICFRLYNGMWSLEFGK